jgi:cell division protein FtsB
MGKLKKFGDYLSKFKYVITVLFFVIVLGFVGENSFVNRYKHKQEIEALTEEIAKYQQQFDRDTERLEELSTSEEALEKIARERYFMSEDDEDVFIFEEESQKP